MKDFCLYLTVGFSLVVAQTTILRLPLFHGIFYDLLIPLVVFLGLRLRDGKGVSVVVILGMIMDLLSGGIFGLYLSTYFWTFLLVKNVSKYFNVDDPIFQSVLMGACVLGQHIVFCAALASPWKWAQLLAGQTIPILLQTTLAALTGPSIFLGLGRLQTRFQTGWPGPRRETEDFATRR
jgi:cell shape-determining protein MreD